MTGKIYKTDDLDFFKFVSALLEGLKIDTFGESWGSIARMIDKSHPAVAELLRNAERRWQELDRE